MLSAAKHLAADRDRPFAALRVTRCDCSNYQVQFAQIEPCLTITMRRVNITRRFVPGVETFTLYHIHDCLKNAIMQASGLFGVLELPLMPALLATRTLVAPAGLCW